MKSSTAQHAPWWWKLVAPHRRILKLGLAATVLCSLAAAWVPYWSGRAVHALELRAWTVSRDYLIWMLAFTLVAGVGLSSLLCGGPVPTVQGPVGTFSPAMLAALLVLLSAASATALFFFPPS